MSTNKSVKRNRARRSLLLAVLGAAAAALLFGLAVEQLRARAQSGPQAPQAIPDGLGEAWLPTGATIFTPAAPCEQVGVLIDTEEVLSFGVPFIQETIVSAGEQVYMAERIALQGTGSGSGSVLLTDADQLGLVNASFPLPANTPLTVQMTLYQGTAEIPAYRSLATLVCNTGAFELLEAGPLAPFPELADIQSRSGIGCLPGDISLGVQTNLAQGELYPLQTTVRDSSGAVVLDDRLVISQTIGVTGLPLLADLPASENLSATLTLQGPTGRPLYRSQAVFECSSGFISVSPGTPLQPQQPSLTLAETVQQLCSAGGTIFSVNQITEAGQTYSYGMRVRSGTNVLVDDTQQGTFNGLPQQPGTNLWTVEADLPTAVPVQVELSLYDAQLRPRYVTAFDYQCATSQPVSNVTSTPYPLLFLPTIVKP